VQGNIKFPKSLFIGPTEKALSTAGAQGQEGCGSLIGRRELAVVDSTDTLLTECPLPHQVCEERGRLSAIAIGSDRHVAQSASVPHLRTWRSFPAENGIEALRQPN
jgi:hypothetical protein